ncbi:CalY family protein [Candidatus Contubernalis alkaliaceticus]|uniref:CalY family protein n=1 Tax=Candidatus Contubernalis alkaliaceticus TaxID=338645 RepID=UPI001F4C50E4|nr:CalY family protein [Candidatus Contubernalis alkalaceticus]UNC92979.1 hypothetical protein HUE98_13260 [Candidatus Contubernalis alkalaceticus]
MKKKIISSLIMITLAAAAMSLGTMAWFTYESDSIANTFTAGTVLIQADETITPPAYMVENWNPGDCTEKEYTIINMGTKAAYIRAVITGSWYNQDGTPFFPDPDLDVVYWGFCDLDMGSQVSGEGNSAQGWIRDGNTWYYEHPLPGTYSGASETERQAVLCLRVCLDGLNTDNQYQGKVFKLSAVFQAVQSSNEAVNQVWPENPYVSSIDENIQDFSMAVFVDDTIRVNGSTKIIGNIATNSTAQNSVSLNFQNDVIVGNVFIGPGGDPENVINVPGSGRTIDDAITGSVFTLDSKRTYNLPAYPTDLPALGNLTVNSSNYTIENDSYYSSINITGNSTLYINTGNTDRIIRVGSLSIAGHIVLQGSGRLLLYVDNFNQVTQTININAAGTASRLIMYVQGNSVNFGSGNTVFRGGLYAPNADVKLLGSSRIMGALIAKSLEAGAADKAAVSFESINLN